MDQKLAERFVFIHQVAALFYVKWRHPETLTSYQKADSVNRYVFAWRTILPKFIPIRFETTESRNFGFLEKRPKKNKNNKNQDE